MVKVYDMVTYEVCGPAGDAAAAMDTSPRSLSRAEIPAPGLQLLEVTPSVAPRLLPESLRHVDLSRFLDEIAS